MDASMQALRRKMIRETEAFLEQCLRDQSERNPTPRPRFPRRTRRHISPRFRRGRDAIVPDAAADLRECCPAPSAAYL